MLNLLLQKMCAVNNMDYVWIYGDVECMLHLILYSYFEY